MKRMGMMKGPRRSAKQTVIDFTTRCLLVLDNPDITPTRRTEFRNHLGAILEISRRMNWTDLTARITRYVRNQPKSLNETPIDGPGIFTEPE